VGLFDWLKRTPPQPITWHVYREGSDVVADDGRGGSYRVALSGARGVRIVPLTRGNQHGGAGLGYQVAVQRTDGDAPIGKPTQDWRPARELARQLCETAELPLDEVTERMFSRVGEFGPKPDA
jgi:hypothetical protein